jgi:hypothetical protein
MDPQILIPLMYSHTFCLVTVFIFSLALYKRPKVHYFVGTGGHGGKVYGTCLTLWEPYTVALPSKHNTTVHTSAPNSPTTITTTTIGAATTATTNNGIASTNKKTRQVYVPKCLVILSTYPYLAAFREYLTQLQRLSRSGEMNVPMERYIVNFCAEIPAPPPGSVDMVATIQSTNCMGIIAVCYFV